jgi:periplasmic protein TonB
MFTHGSLAQTNPPSPRNSTPYEIQISPEVATNLLIHKVNPDVCPHVATAARITATVVVGFSIDKSGNVLYPKVISGPPMLRKPILDAVRKYKYKPYILNGKPVEVETTVSVPIDNYRDCHIE